MILDELLVGLGFDYNPEDLAKFKSDIDKVNGALTSLVKVAAGAATAITGMTVASTASSDEHGKLADEIGVLVEEIDALEFANRRSGGSSEGLTSSLRGVQQAAFQASRGVGAGITAFGRLGVSVLDANDNIKSADSLLLEVSSAMQGLDKTAQIDLAGKLGLSGSIRLLQQGPAAIREMTDEAKDLGVVTDEDATIAADFQDSLTNLWMVISQVGRVISRSFAPLLKEVTDRFTDWWKANRNLIESKFTAWIENLTTGFKLLTVAAGAFLAFKLGAQLISLIAIMRGLTVATLGANAAIFLLPALIISAIAAVVALAEDAKVFFDGGESFIGDMIKKFPLWADELHAVAAIFATLADLTMMIFEGWGKIISAVTNFSLPDASEFFGNLPGFVGELTDKLFGKFEPPLADKLLGSPSTSGEINRNVINSLGASTNLGALNSNDIAPAKTGISNSQNIDKVEINVTGGGDAQEIARETFNLFQQTAQDLSSAVDQ